MPRTLANPQCTIVFRQRFEEGDILRSAASTGALAAMLWFVPGCEAVGGQISTQSRTGAILDIELQEKWLSG